MPLLRDTATRVRDDRAAPIRSDGEASSSGRGSKKPYRLLASIGAASLGLMLVAGTALGRGGLDGHLHLTSLGEAARGKARVSRHKGHGATVGAGRTTRPRPWAQQRRQDPAASATSRWSRAASGRCHGRTRSARRRSRPRTASANAARRAGARAGPSASRARARAHERATDAPRPTRRRTTRQPSPTTTRERVRAPQGSRPAPVEDEHRG